MKNADSGRLLYSYPTDGVLRNAAATRRSPPPKPDSAAVRRYAEQLLIEAADVPPFDGFQMYAR